MGSKKGVNPAKFSALALQTYAPDDMLTRNEVEVTRESITKPSWGLALKT